MVDVSTIYHIQVRLCPSGAMVRIVQLFFMIPYQPCVRTQRDNQMC
jgi:hypothetical protein